MIEQDLKRIQEAQQEIMEILTTTKKPAETKRWYTNDEILELLKVSRRTLSNWRDKGLIGFSQVGSKIYYNQADVEGFMNQHYREPFNKEF